MTRKFLLLFTCLLGWMACSTKEQPLSKTAWLVGTWENSSGEGLTYETWVKQNDSLMIGSSYQIEDEDTVMLESIVLMQVKDELYYIPRVVGQNNNEPVPFELIFQSEKEIRFENKAHDFPQCISYTRIAEDSILAAISGTLNGKTKVIDFPMRKVK